MLHLQKKGPSQAHRKGYDMYSGVQTSDGINNFEMITLDWVQRTLVETANPTASRTRINYMRLIELMKNCYNFYDFFRGTLLVL